MSEDTLRWDAEGAVSDHVVDDRYGPVCAAYDVPRDCAASDIFVTLYLRTLGICLSSQAWMGRRRKYRSKGARGQRKGNLLPLAERLKD